MQLNMFTISETHIAYLYSVFSHFIYYEWYNIINININLNKRETILWRVRYTQKKKKTFKY